MTARELLEETRSRLDAPAAASSNLNWLVAGLLEAIVNEGLERLNVDADDAQVDLVESDEPAWGRSARWVVLRTPRARFQALFSVGEDAALGMLPGRQVGPSRFIA